ncbi:ACR016Wp [Eremothecium gossypii ATCC 10895]|uniref:ACR016Wp n=1 Tax=Eremothecium gossypii (strain ATCC 10895 / CBS 109.51 / FGSC 9923 / NRRL Y-1056) TaxID=284811 RepID=Q75CE4_EREGS|nr:ACR016Wp [Eremothecium gossypii ATCC 10895]AAS51243.1 ACR016Wp [Eremothecium gossypii ATCC 10895]AEY95534.1 FACR016Wp [Eremothecium gossypii FDAG1]
MAKKGKKDKDAKKARAEAKSKKSLLKAEQKDKKKAKKLGADDDDDMDIEEVLANFKRQQAEFEAVNVETVERPHQRSSSSLVANPLHNKRELILFGGEYTNQSTGMTHFYNDLFIYSLDTDQWKKYTSQNSPMPRSSAAIAAHPSGVVLIHGGEFSSPKQNTFYHYSDTWLFDCATHEWTKIEQKNGPSSRSGHRMTVWKNYIILHGGFRDLGTSTTYLNDCWLFDITTYKWQQLQFPANHPIPDARSGHSLLPTPEGAILWGGYCKVKAGKGLQKGKILTDCWYLKMKSDVTAIRWERRKKQGFQPSSRAGCSMVHHKGRGILFGGVYDYEETEEGLDSLFYNDLFTYHIETNRWYSVSLRAQRHSKVKSAPKSNRDKDKELEDMLNAILKKANLDDDDGDEDGKTIEEELNKLENDGITETEETKKSYPIVMKLPHPRFNASTAIVDDTLFIFGGVWEQGEKDYMIDSFYSIDMNKVDGVKVYWEDMAAVERAKELGEEDEDDAEDDEDDDSEDDDEEEHSDRKLVAEEEEEEEEEDNEILPEIPDPRPWLPHPKAFESLRAFYVRTGASFLEWAITNKHNTRSDAKGKHLKKHSFDLCQERWWERREQVRIEEDKLEELGGVGEVIEKDFTKPTKRR